MFNKKIIFSLLALSSAPIVGAQNWDESLDGGGDSGIQDAAQPVALEGTFTTISGSLDPAGGDHVDCYQIKVSDVTSFYATSDPGVDPAAVIGEPDTRLWIWNEDGSAIISGNDDSPGQPGWLSVVADPVSGPIAYAAAPTNPVTTSLVDDNLYVLCLSYFPNDPEDVGLVDLVDMATFEALNGPNPAAGPFAAYENTGSDPAASYTLAFAGAEGTVVEYSVGGTLTGLLAGNDVTLQNNGGDNIILNANGPYVFPTTLSDGASYDVTVLAQPTGPLQTCVAVNSSGTIAGSNVTNVDVSCDNLDLIFRNGFEPTP